MDGRRGPHGPREADRRVTSPTRPRWTPEKRPAPGLTADYHARLRALPVRPPFALAGKKPAALAPLPPLPNENLDPDYTAGPVHPGLLRRPPGRLPPSATWPPRHGRGEPQRKELGFGRTSTTHVPGDPPQPARFQDGTRTSRPSDPHDDDYVWAGPETDQPWLRGGSYWWPARSGSSSKLDRDYLQDQEKRRHRPRQGVRRPAHRRNRFTTPDFTRTDSGGQPSSPAMPTSGWPASANGGTGSAPRVLLHRRHRPANRNPPRRLFFIRLP